MTRQELEEQALQLPPAEREELALRLMASLENHPLTAIDREWIEEAERRWDAVLSGQSKGVPLAEAIDEIRRKLAGKQP